MKHILTLVINEETESSKRLRNLYDKFWLVGVSTAARILRCVLLSCLHRAAFGAMWPQSLHRQGFKNTNQSRAQLQSQEQHYQQRTWHHCVGVTGEPPSSYKRTRHQNDEPPCKPPRLYLLPLIPPSILWQRRDPKGLKRNSRDTSLTLTFSNSSAFYEKGSHGCIFVTRHLGPSRLCPSASMEIRSKMLTWCRISVRLVASSAMYLLMPPSFSLKYCKVNWECVGII